MRRAWFLWLLLSAACSSVQVDDRDVSSNANEVLRMEQLKRQLREEELKREETMAEARRIHAEAERRREEERKAEERLEAERRRAAEQERARREAARAEEIRKASEATEADRRAEEQRAAEKQEEERKAEEQRRLEEERRRAAEEKRRARDALLARTDPDKNSFFRREMETELEDLDCSGTQGVRLYRNKRSLQFMGAGRHLDSPDVDQGTSVSRLSASVRGPGNFIPLSGSADMRLVECKASSLVLRILNIRSDGAGNYWILLEDRKGLIYSILREDLELGPEAN